MAEIWEIIVQIIAIVGSVFGIQVWFGIQRRGDILRLEEKVEKMVKKMMNFLKPTRKDMRICIQELATSHKESRIWKERKIAEVIRW